MKILELIALSYGSVPGTDPYDRAINSKIFLIKDEVVFLKKVLQIVKDLRS